MTRGVPSWCVVVVFWAHTRAARMVDWINPRITVSDPHPMPPMASVVDHTYPASSYANQPRATPCLGAPGSPLPPPPLATPPQITFSRPLAPRAEHTELLDFGREQVCGGVHTCVAQSAGCSENATWVIQARLTYTRAHLHKYTQACARMRTRASTYSLSLSLSLTYTHTHILTHAHIEAVRGGG